MKKLTPIAAIAAFGLFRGIHEGMVMHLPNVRCHGWFGWYHIEAVATLVVFAVAVGLWLRWRPGWLATLGLLLLCWQCTEFGYALARSGGLIYHLNGAAYEHLYLTDKWSWEITGWQVYAMTAIRIVVAITLITRGESDEMDKSISDDGCDFDDLLFDGSCGSARRG